MSDLDLFCKCSESLFGPQWQSEMARALDVNIRTVQRWASGSNDLSPWVFEKLPALLNERQAELAKLNKLVQGRTSASE